MLKEMNAIYFTVKLGCFFKIIIDKVQLVLGSVFHLNASLF